MADTHAPLQAEEPQCSKFARLWPPLDARCSHCGHLLGVYVEVGGKYWIMVGEVIARLLHGKCSNCGVEFYHSPGDVIMERITGGKQP